MALQPTLHSGLETVPINLVEATPEALEGYGKLIDDPADCVIEIAVWPAPGWRAVDAGTGQEGGTTEGVFRFWWEEGVYMGENEAVNDSYILGWSYPPQEPAPGQHHSRESAYMWHANYHPDGGQLFFPSTDKPSSLPWLRRETIRGPRASRPSIATDRRGSTSIPTSGTRRSTCLMIRDVSSTGNPRSMPESVSIFQTSSAAC